jgi:hypothetical protein
VLLDASAFGHIHHGSNVFEQLAPLVQNRMSQRMQVPHGSPGQHDSVVRYVIALLADDPPGELEHPLPVFRMEPAEYLFLLRQTTAPRIESIDSELLVRVVRVFLSHVVVGPTARVSEPLGFRKVCLTLLQRLLCALTLGQVEREADTLVLTRKKGPAGQYGHAAAVLTDELPLERLQAPTTANLCRQLLKVTIEVAGKREISPAEAARYEIIALVSHYAQKRIIGFDNATIEIPNADSDDVGVNQPAELSLACGNVAV